MKQNRNKKKLTLEKIKITKLENPNVIIGGAPVPTTIPVVTVTCTKLDVNCITTTNSTATEPTEFI